MKKISVLLFILLSAQLCGCSDPAAKTGETTASESSSTETGIVPDEENGPEDSETLDDLEDSEIPAEESNDNDSGVSTEQKDTLLSVPDTGKVDVPVQDTVPQPEETVSPANDSCYSVATDIPRTDVESYAARIKQQFLEHDWSAISSEISYPITISDVTYNSSADFLDASNSFDSNLEETFFSTLEEEDCVEMFCSWEGIMLGESGQIWISEVLDAELKSQGLKIIAVNGMLKK